MEVRKSKNTIFEIGFDLKLSPTSDPYKMRGRIIEEWALAIWTCLIRWNLLMISDLLFGSFANFGELLYFQTKRLGISLGL